MSKQVSIHDEFIERADQVASAVGVTRHDVINLAVGEFLDKHRIINQDPWDVAHVRMSFKEKAITK